MYAGQVKRKKINLWLLVLVVLFIMALIFTIIHMTNSSRANSDSRYNNVTQQNSENISKNTQENTITNKESDGSEIGQVDSYDLFSDIETSQNAENRETQERAVPVKLDNHTYTFKDIGKASIQGNKPNQYVELKTKTLLYKILVNKSSFSDLLNKEGLKQYIQDTYRVQVTSELKTGNMNNMKIILCTVADGKNVAYLIITPLNDSESLVLKVYDARNAFGLIQDLTEPFNELEKIKTNIQ